MNTIHPYLNFEGNCREAFQFYSQCLGAELTVQTIAESPIAAQCQPHMQQQVVHATLSKEGLLMMGSDMCGPDGRVQGNSMALSYQCSSADEINGLFQKLSEGGKVIEGVSRQFWGGLFCTFTDKYGVRWMLLADAPEENGQWQQLHFSIDIDAPKEKIWAVMLADESYREWTSAFHPGSYAEGSWQEGSTVYFKTPEGDGMISRVVVHRPAEMISVEHQGVLHGGKEVPEHPEGKKWKGAKETYRVEEDARGTKLFIEQDIVPEYREHMEKAWPAALQKLKSLSEKAMAMA